MIERIKINRIIIYILTLLNILYQIVYMTFGRYMTSELGNLIYVFYVFRPEYMIISGLVSCVAFCAILMILFKSKRHLYFGDIIILLLNVEYMIYYIKLIMKQ